MEEPNDFDDEEQILWPGSPSFNSNSNGSSNGEIFDIDSALSQNSSPAGFNLDNNNSEQSNESTFVETLNPTPLPSPEYYQQWLDYLLQCRDNPKQIADLNNPKGSKMLGDLVTFINQPNALQMLQYYGFTEYNNEMTGIFIQPATKEFKKPDFEANFPFGDKGGPQKGKEKDGYIYKYWTGKTDKSYKMRKFYKDNGVAIFVVFRHVKHSVSPSSSSEPSVNTEPANKKARVGGNSPFSSSSANGEMSSPTRLSNNNNQPTPNGNYNNNGSAATNYSQQLTLNDTTITTSNNTNTASYNPLHTPEHLSNRIDSLSDRVDELAGRMVKVELNSTSTSKIVTMTPQQRELGKIILRVLRESGGRHQFGSPLATKVRDILGRKTMITKVVNNTLYNVLAPLGIVQLQDKEWVLIDEAKAQEFEQQQ